MAAMLLGGNEVAGAADAAGGNIPSPTPDAAGIDIPLSPTTDVAGGPIPSPTPIAADDNPPTPLREPTPSPTSEPATYTRLPTPSPTRQPFEDDVHSGGDFHVSPTRSYEAPHTSGQPIGGAEDPDALSSMSTLLNRCMQKVEEFETELKDTKLPIPPRCPIQEEGA